MTDYAHINDDEIVIEIILAFSTVETDRPPAPIIGEGKEPTAQQLEQQRLHDEFVPGEVPIESRFAPDVVAALVPIPEGLSVAQGDSYAGGQFGPPPPVVLPPVTAEQVKAQRDAWLAEATLRIAPLQDAVDLGEASAEEIALLALWKKYRVNLSRIELQAGFPTAVVWPTPPL